MEKCCCIFASGTCGRWRNAAHLSVLVCTAALAEYELTGCYNAQSFDLAQYPKGPLELIGWSIVGFAVGAGIMAVLILTKLGQRWLPGKLRGTTLIPEDVKLITVPALAAFLVIAVISPYKSLRYVYHLQPLEALFCGCGLFSILIRCVQAPESAFCRSCALQWSCLHL